MKTRKEDLPALDAAICSALRVEHARQEERIIMHDWLQKRRNEVRALFEEIDAQIKNLEREINDAKKMASELKHNAEMSHGSAAKNQSP